MDPSQKFARRFFQDPGRKLEKSTAGKLVKETGVGGLNVYILKVF